MIYTIGKSEAYDQYIRTDPKAAKGVGGSVWKTRTQAEAYCKLANQTPNANFKVYGVKANWKKYTVYTAGEGWHDLIIPAQLVQLDHE